MEQTENQKQILTTRKFLAELEAKEITTEAAAEAETPPPFDIDRIRPGMTAHDVQKAGKAIMEALRADGYA